MARKTKKDLLSIADLSSKEIFELLDLAIQLKRAQKSGRQKPVLAGKSLALIFEKPSMRTRVSFEVGMKQLGGTTVHLRSEEIGMGTREDIRDVARTLSRYVDGIMARTFAHESVQELASYATIPVINGLSNLTHPCQALADLLTIWEKFGRSAKPSEKDFRKLKLVYIGDGNNVCHSLMLGAAKVGLSMAIATPMTFEPRPDFQVMAQKEAKAHGATVEITSAPREAVDQADVVYTDVWTSMGQEDEKESREMIFKPFQISKALLRTAKSHVKVMHCLPAHRGEEITEEVLESNYSIVFDQAENRLHAQKAVLVSLLS